MAHLFLLFSSEPPPHPFFQGGGVEGKTNIPLGEPIKRKLPMNSVKGPSFSIRTNHVIRGFITTIYITNQNGISYTLN